MSPTFTDIVMPARVRREAAVENPYPDRRVEGLGKRLSMMTTILNRGKREVDIEGIGMRRRSKVLIVRIVLS